jgi:hypothetical protein
MPLGYLSISFPVRHVLTAEQRICNHTLTRELAVTYCFDKHPLRLHYCPETAIGSTGARETNHLRAITAQYRDAHAADHSVIIRQSKGMSGSRLAYHLPRGIVRQSSVPPHVRTQSRSSLSPHVRRTSASPRVVHFPTAWLSHSPRALPHVEPTNTRLSRTRPLTHPARQQSLDSCTIIDE